jgi:hypothetical protein
MEGCVSVSKRLRFEILRRDAHACRYCGAAAPDVRLTVDHVIPITLGGRDDPENLVTACAGCNAGKTSIAPDSSLVANVADDALRWARAMVMAAELADAAKTKMHNEVNELGKGWSDHFDNEHATAEEIERARRAGFYRDPSWRQTFTRFLSAGLTKHDLWELIDDVMARENVENGRLWRYFCGACWKNLRERQETARGLIDSGEVA